MKTVTLTIGFTSSFLLQSVIHLQLLSLPCVFAAEDEVPSYMSKLFEDLSARKKLFEDTPPEEIKYWFEYAGPLQVRKSLWVSQTRLHVLYKNHVKKERERGEDDL